MPVRADEGYAGLSIPHQPLNWPPSFDDRGCVFFVIRFCDFAFGFAQNDKGDFSEDEDLLFWESYTYPVYET